MYSVIETKLFRFLEDNKDYAISLLSKLIAIPTVNPPGANYEEIVAFLEKECKRIGLRTRIYLTPKSVLDKFGVKGGSKRISLIAYRFTGAQKTLHICSHYDVVPATDKWNRGPYKAVIQGGKVYGRGAEDMKGNIACVLLSLKAIKECGIKLKVNMELSFTPDEEIGGRTGLGYLVENDLVNADYAMSEGYSQEYVSVGNKGVLWAEVTVKGRACHASLPHRGVNSFDRMIELASDFNKLKKKISTRKTRYSMKDYIAKSPTLVMGGLLEGGIKVNVVPGVVRFSIDRRLIPEETIEAAIEEIKGVIRRFNRKHRDSKAGVEFRSKENPSISRKDYKFFKTVFDSIELVIGRRPKFSVMPGATDLRYFMWKGVPCLGYSARGGETWHSDNEFVYIDSLVDTAKVYALVMGNLQ